MIRPSMLAIALVALVSCGETPTPTPTPGPPVNFVGNDTCPTTNVQAYSPSPPGTNGAGVGQAIDEMPHSHVNPPTKVTYIHNPPTSGCHYNLGFGAAPINPGSYDQVISPEYWVHNLEHGYVVALYNCPGGSNGVNGCATEFQQLHDWAKALPKDPAGFVSYAKVLVLPFPGMPKKFAMVSWDWYDGMDTLNMTEVQSFYDNHVGQSPESLQSP